MGRNFADGVLPGQVMLMPLDPREWLPARHLAWEVLEQVAGMDLAGFEAGYRADGQGGRAYHPAMMCALLIYCYCKGIRSARDIEMATWDDVGARVICGNLHPDHATAARFAGRHREALCGLLAQSVKACAREGLVSLELAAGDGTKLKASASMTANVTAQELDAQIAALEELIEDGVRAWVSGQLGPDDEPPPGPGAGADPGPGAAGGRGKKSRKAPRRPAMMLARRRQARAQLAARQQAWLDQEQQKLTARAAELDERLGRKLEAAARAERAALGKLDTWLRKAAAGSTPRGGRPRGPDADRDVKSARAQVEKVRGLHAEAAAAAAAGPVPDPEARVNTTDWTSRVMPLKKGGYDQLVNAQVLATAGSQVILAVLRHDSPADTRALHPLLAAARATLDAAGIPGPIGKAVFDAGYASDANFTAPAEAELYVAVTRESRQAGRSAEGRDPAALPSWQDMAARLDTPAGRAVYRKRAGTIEPVFAQLTARLGRSLNYRGDMAGTELHLWAVSHNILKAIRARQASHRRAARAAAA